MKLREALARALVEDHGITTMFGVTGGGNLMIVDDYVFQSGGTLVRPVREDGAVLAALGYSHATGELGVATVSHGPGFTNAITALTEGARSRTPMLVIAGDTALTDRDNLQDIDQPPLVIASGCGLVQVNSASTGLVDLATAIRRAFAERRPIVLNIPNDVIESPVEEYVSHTRDRIDVQRVAPSAEALDQALGVIANARRPLVLAGWGAAVSGAREALVAFAERLGAPLATTLKAKGFFRGEPFDLGVFGSMASVTGGEAIGQADCIIAFGAGLNIYTTAHGALLEGKSVVQVDQFPGNLGRTFPATVEVVGDARTVAESMTEWLGAIDAPPSSYRSEALRERLAAYDPASEFDDLSGDGAVDLRTFMVRLDEMLPENRNVVTDGGRFVVAPMRYLNSYEPRAFLAPLAFGSIGLSLGAALGVAYGRPDAPTVLVTGDGGLMMNLIEFTTAVREHLDLIVVVFNDRCYGTEYHVYQQRSDNPEQAVALAKFDWPELAEVATALGGRGLAVRSLDDLDEVRKAIETRDRPLFLEVIVDPARRVGFMD